MKHCMTMLALLAVFFTGPALAHGKKVHVRGRVEKISADSMLVQTPDGKSAEVKLVASTIYVSRSNHEDIPAKLADLAIGDFVVVHGTTKGNALEADEIKFSVPGATKGTPPAIQKPKS